MAYDLMTTERIARKYETCRDDDQVVHALSWDGTAACGIRRRIWLHEVPRPEPVTCMGCILAEAE